MVRFALPAAAALAARAVVRVGGPRAAVRRALALEVGAGGGHRAKRNRNWARGEEKFF